MSKVLYISFPIVIKIVWIIMEWSFEIMRVHRHHNRGDFIFARLIEGQADLEVKEGSALGGIPILSLCRNAKET